MAGLGSLGRLLPTHHHGASTTTPRPTAAVVVCHDVVRHVRVAPTKHDQPAKTTCRSVEPVEQGAALGGIQDPGSIGNFNTSRFPDQGPGPEIPPDPSGAQQAQPRGRAFVHEGLGHRQWTWGGSFEVFCVLGGPSAAAAAPGRGFGTRAVWAGAKFEFLSWPSDVVLNFAMSFCISLACRVYWVVTCRDGAMI